MDTMVITCDDERLTELFNTKMNGDEQQLFVKSFKMYLKHGRDDKAFVIDLDDVWSWMGFSRKDPAMRVLTRNFVENDHYVKKVVLHRPAENPLGGRPKEQILMTVKTFKKFCLLARTEEASKVQDYYIKMEEILQDYVEDCLKQSNERLKQSNERISMLDAELKSSNEDLAIAQEESRWARHRGLLGGYGGRKVVYVMNMLSLDEGSFVIKIGSTDNIQDRVAKIKHQHGIPVCVIDVYQCDRNRAFETSVHSRLKDKHYTDLIGKQSSTEAFLMQNERDYNAVKKMMQQMVHSYKQYSLEEKLADITKSKQEMRDRIYADYMAGKKNMTFEQFQEILRMMGCNDEDKTVHEEDPITTHDETAPTTSRVRPINIGYKVQLYNPTDLTKVVRVIDGMVDATIEIEGCSYSQMKVAARDKFVYKGYRWYFIPKNDPEPFKPRDIGVTRDHQRYRKGYTAKLNEHKQVVEVFASQKQAAEAMSVSQSVISVAFQNGKQAKGFYWSNWHDLASEIQEEYLTCHTLPEPLAHHRATHIEKLNPITREVLHVYKSFAEIQKQTRITPKMIKDASRSGRILDGYVWRIADADMV